MIVAILAMAIVVTASNILVQFPFGDWLTLGAFTYPIAFLVTDSCNRLMGPARARQVALVGFALAVLLSLVLATPRIAIASGTAFLAAQLLDIAIFNRLRDQRWWRAPLLSSILGSALDTLLFFTLAFAAGVTFIGPGDAFAIEPVALIPGLLPELPRWMGWAMGDFAVKLSMAFLALAPYALVVRGLRSARA